ncbi:hypothetical protein RAS1_04520 [Phycisphaerae bacterium RAS1]|nr:hypothetical protein RAS1_04520 [Phycisphaerae bacterium RAS1]
MNIQACHECGKSAAVRVLRGYSHGVPDFRDLCLSCADERDRAAVRQQRRETQLPTKALLLMAGCMLMLIALSWDFLSLATRPGFGVFQRLGTALALVLVLLGAVSRTDVIAIMGAAMLALSLGADVLATDHVPGIGWKQQFVLLVGVGACGLAVWRPWRLSARTLLGVAERTT